MQPPSNRTVGLAVGALIVLTLFHFTDNIVNVEEYPRPSWQSATFVQVAAVVVWLVFAGLGVIGYRLYRNERFHLAHSYLGASSFLGLVSLLHFTAGPPDELTTRGLVSVLIDGVVGLAVLGVTLWSVLARRGEAMRPAGAASGGGPR